MVSTAVFPAGSGMLAYERSMDWGSMWLVGGCHTALLQCSHLGGA